MGLMYNIHGSYVQYTCVLCTIPVVLVRFQSHLTFLDILSEKTQMSNLMNIRQLESSCSMRTDGRTDKTKLITAFRNFENAHKKKERNKTRDKEGKQKVEDGRERG